MLIRMVVARVWQDAGRERPLGIGEVHDVPDPVGRQLLREGSAMHAQMAAPETKQRGRRRA